MKWRACSTFQDRPFEYECDATIQYAPAMLAEAIETWLACGMGQAIDTGGKPNYARKPAAGAYDGKALDVQPVAE